MASLLPSDTGSGTVKTDYFSLIYSSVRKIQWRNLGTFNPGQECVNKQLVISGWPGGRAPRTWEAPRNSRLVLGYFLTSWISMMYSEILRGRSITPQTRRRPKGSRAVFAHMQQIAHPFSLHFGKVWGYLKLLATKLHKFRFRHACISLRQLSYFRHEVFLRNYLWRIYY